MQLTPSKKKTILTELLREYGEKTDIETRDGFITRSRALVDVVWRLAIRGDVSCIKYIFDRLDGPMTQDYNVHSTQEVLVVGPPPPDEVPIEVEIND